MFDLEKITPSLLIETAKNRFGSADYNSEDLPDDPKHWADQVLIKLLVEKLETVQLLNSLSQQSYTRSSDMDEDQEFNLSDVERGDHFFCSGKEYIVTDKGARVLIGIEVDAKARNDPTWLDGPPYAMVEHVFDETDIPAITLKQDAEEEKLRSPTL